MGEKIRRQLITGLLMTVSLVVVLGLIYPIVTTRSEGSKVTDIDANTYVDFVMGFGASLFGHRPPFVVQAVRNQLEQGFEIGPIQPLAGEVAALVKEFTGMQRVVFANTGSEAVMAAIRSALRQYWSPVASNW